MKHIFTAAVAACLLCSTAAMADFKAYEVEARYRQEVYEALRNLLAPPSSQVLGRAEMLPTGQILVYAAPETLQQSRPCSKALRRDSRLPRRA